MWEEVRGYVVLFVLIPLGLGLAWYIAYFAFTGSWPNPPRYDCSTDYDGHSNPTVCGD